jgi:alkylhydroperoxidase family enzyme
VSEARVPRLSHDETAAAAEQVGLPIYLADLDIFRVLFRHPPLARAFNDLLAQLLLKNQLDGRLRELVIMRIGWQTGSVYEWTQHWRIARGLGVAADDLLAVRDWRASDRFGPAERAVLAATDDVLADGMIGSGTWAACAAELRSAEERLELVAAIGGWLMTSTMLRSLEVPLEDGVEAWPPDGRAPEGMRP